MEEVSFLFFPLKAIKPKRTLVSHAPRFFGSFQGLTRLPFWQEQHVDEDEYGAMVE